MFGIYFGFEVFFFGLCVLCYISSWVGMILPLYLTLGFSSELCGVGLVDRF